jgi:hypothetical protein
MSRTASREVQVFANAPPRLALECRAFFVRPRFSYSFGMPHSPAAMSRRFISGVVGTAPMDFNHRRNSGNVFGAFFTTSGGTRNSLCLIRVVFVERFEVVDGIFQGYVETYLGQPKFFAEPASGGEQILMGNSVRRVEARRNSVPVGRASHESHQKGNDLTVDGGELQGDVTTLIEPNDERFVTHDSAKSRSVIHAHPVPSACRTEIRVQISDRDRPARRRKDRAAP